MPDYGQRPPPYISADQGVLGKAPYGWQGTPAANPNNVPSTGFFPAEQFAYERLDWAKFKAQIAKEGLDTILGMHLLVGRDPNGYFSNPPFMGAGQMTGPNGPPSWMREVDGGVRRIVRGYLRRQNVTPGKPETFVRLYYMYNPDQIQRTYQSWTDSSTIDPAEPGVEADNSIATIPFVTTMTFTLYFDRQIEVATTENHPGVLVDLQALDTLSGQMIVQQTTAGDSVVLPTGMVIPDYVDVTENNAGQIQPTLGAGIRVTAVFSPNLAVEGILSGLSVTFTKFSPKMTPVTMAVTLTLAVQFVGKDNNQNLASNVGSGAQAGPAGYNPGSPNFVSPESQADRNTVTQAGAAAALKYAQDTLKDTETVPGNNHYSVVNRAVGPPCTSIEANSEGTSFTDDTSLVWRSFHSVGWAGPETGALLHLGGSCDNPASVDDFTQAMTSTGAPWKLLQDLWHPANQHEGDDRQLAVAMVGELKNLRPGDVLVRKPGYTEDEGHVAFFVTLSGDPTTDNWTSKIIQLFHSTGEDRKTDGGSGYKLGGAQIGYSPQQFFAEYNLWARPEPFGSTNDEDASKVLSANGMLTIDETVEAVTGQGNNIRLSPEALPAWKAWRAAWGGPIPCTSGWRDPVEQEAAYQADKKAGGNRYAPAAKSYHCKGQAVDVDNGWLQALPAGEQSRLRQAAVSAGWGQARWRVKGSGPTAGHEAACNASKSTDTSEPWHFSWGGCG